MTLAPSTAFDILPRTDITFCYVCNGIIQTKRVEGDKARKAQEDQQKAREAFLLPDHFDIHPLLCDARGCFQKYSILPKQLYFEADVSYGTTITFDHGPFFGFPGRIGWSAIDEGNTLNPLGESHDKDVDNLEPLFQAWLFFGLLHEVLQDSFIESDFVRLDENGNRVLSLMVIPKVMALWMLTVSRTTNDSEAIFTRLNNALQITFNMLKAIQYKRFDEGLRVHIASGGEMISQSLKSLFPQEDVTENFTLFYHRMPERRLIGLGWCPSEAEFSPLQSPTIARQALYSQIDRRDRQPSHTACTSTRCEQSSIAQQHHAILSHRWDCPHVRCHPIGLSRSQTQDVCDALDDGTFPLLQVVTDNNEVLSLKLSAYKPGDRYIAISHVWAQGLGNDNENVLSTCQLQHLQQKVQAVWNLMFSDKGGECLFWLDTICCPVQAGAENRYRKLAIGIMRETYAKATAVLAIETEWGRIQSLAFSPLEIAARVFVSSWFQRLWTLQEGTLPAQVWFQFQDRAINAHSLYLALRDVLRGLDMRDRLAATEMLGLFMSLRILSGAYGSTSQEQEMSMLTRAMARRKVMHSKDEAICIATLLGLDTFRILAESDIGERMKAMYWEMSRKRLIPRNIVFSPGGKLKMPGFSWAYSTFMQELAPLGFISDPTIKGIASEYGLLISGEGIVFKMATPTQGFNPSCMLGNLPADVYVFNIRLQHDEWRQFTIKDGGLPGIEQAQPNNRIPRWADFWQSKNEYALLKKHVSTCFMSIDDGTYLLVEVKAKRGNALLCRQLNVGTLRALSSEESANNSRACFQAGVLQGHDDFRALNHSGNQATGGGAREDEFSRHMNILKHFQFDHQLLERDDFPRNLLPVGPDHSFGIRLATALAGRYAVTKEQVPENQKWYID